MSGDYEVAVRDRQVAHGTHRQIALQRAPVCTIIERNVYSNFGGSVQQSFPFWIFTNSPYRGVGRQIAIHALPALTKIRRLEGVRSPVIAFVAIYCHVSGSGIEVAGFY